MELMHYSTVELLDRRLTLTLVRRPYDAVGRLPRLVVVERRTALTVVASRVVFAHALPMDLPQAQNVLLLKYVTYLFKIYRVHTYDELQERRACNAN